MPRSKLTLISVKKLKPPKTGQTDHFDEILPSFGLRISYSGSKSWFVITRINGKQKRITLGRHPAISLSDARNMAREAMELASRGLDYRQIREEERLAIEQAALDSLQSIAEEFMVKYVVPNLKKSTAKEYRRVLLGRDTTDLGKRPVSSIKRRDLIQHLDDVASRVSDAAADYHLRYLRKFFNWCVEREIIEAAPTDRMRQRSSAQKRDRVLDENEIKQVWHAFEREGGLFGDLFKLLLLTGQRRNEVAGMQVRELRDLEGDNPVWELPANRTKNKLPHLVSLTPQMVHLIKSKSVQNGFVFTTTGSTPVSGFSAAKKRIDECIELPMEAWRLHDLRRTMITMMNEKLGIQPHIAEAVVNHITGPAKAGVAGVYNKALYLEERRNALNKWSDYIEYLIAGPGEQPQIKTMSSSDEQLSQIKEALVNLMGGLDGAYNLFVESDDLNNKLDAWIASQFEISRYLMQSPSLRARQIAQMILQLIAVLGDIRSNRKKDEDNPNRIEVTLKTNREINRAFMAAKMDYYKLVGYNQTEWTKKLTNEAKKRGLDVTVGSIKSWRKNLTRLSGQNNHNLQMAIRSYRELKNQINNHIKNHEQLFGKIKRSALEKYLLNYWWLQ